MADEAPWGRGWFSRGKATSFQKIDERSWCIEMQGEKQFSFSSDTEKLVLELSADIHRITVKHKGIQHTHFYCWSDQKLWLSDKGQVYCWERPNPLATAEEDESTGIIKAPMLGRIVAVNVTQGTEINKGDVLLVIEAMKMEHPVLAKTSGRLDELHCALGDQVRADQILGQLVEH